MLFFFYLSLRREKKFPCYKMSKKMSNTLGKMQMYKRRFTNSSLIKNLPIDQYAETTTPDTTPDVSSNKIVIFITLVLFFI